MSIYCLLFEKAFATDHIKVCVDYKQKTLEISIYLKYVWPISRNDSIKLLIIDVRSKQVF